VARPTSVSLPASTHADTLANTHLENSELPGPIQGDPAQGSLDFDFDSIMIYPSDAQTDTTACRNDIAKCPIVRRAGLNQDGTPKFEYIPAKYKPSKMDVQFVRKHYPWREEEAKVKRREW
jgi:hypothetical protein